MKKKEEPKLKRTIEVDSTIEDLIDDSYGSIQEFFDAMVESNQLLRMKLAKHIKECES